MGLYLQDNQNNAHIFKFKPRTRIDFEHEKGTNIYVER